MRIAHTDEQERLRRELRCQEIVDTDGAAVLEFDEVGLDPDRILGDDGLVAEWLTARATIGLCATQLGVTERALELTANYASRRVQFDRPIGTFQAVSQRLADAYIDVEAIRLTPVVAPVLAPVVAPVVAPVDSG
jgi:alkylation response protein AidB-like acyl-CoA dehydrogenase